jgi:hypothetical protein
VAREDPLKEGDDGGKLLFIGVHHPRVKLSRSFDLDFRIAEESWIRQIDC